MLKKQDRNFIVKAKQGKKLPCFCFYSVTSTNYLAKVFVSENVITSPAIFLAKEQTQGRGRYSRSFVSPKGGVYMTYISPATGEFPLWAIYSAVAVMRVLCHLGVRKDRLTIKWPNDVKIDGKKVCGILPESVVTDKRYVALGIGVNVNTDSEDLEEVKDIATSIWQSVGKKFSVKKVAKLLVQQLYSIIETEDKDVVLDEYKKHLETLGKTVRADDGFEGVATSITADGAIVLTSSEGQKEINWGEVCYVK